MDKHLWVRDAEIPLISACPFGGSHLTLRNISSWQKLSSATILGSFHLPSRKFATGEDPLGI